MDERNPYAPPAVELRSPDAVLTLEFEMDEKVYLRSLSCYLGALGAGPTVTALFGIAAIVVSAGFFAGTASSLMADFSQSTKSYITLAFSTAIVLGFLVFPQWARYYLWTLPAARRRLRAQQERYPLQWGAWRVELDGQELRLFTPGGVKSWPLSQTTLPMLDTAEGRLANSCAILAGVVLIPIPKDTLSDMPSGQLRRTLEERCLTSRRI